MIVNGHTCPTVIVPLHRRERFDDSSHQLFVNDHLNALSVTTEHAQQSAHSCRHRRIIGNAQQMLLNIAAKRLQLY